MASSRCDVSHEGQPRGKDIDPGKQTKQRNMGCIQRGPSGPQNLAVFTHVREIINDLAREI